MIIIVICQREGKGRSENQKNPSHHPNRDVTSKKQEQQQQKQNKTKKNKNTYNI